MSNTNTTVKIDASNNFSGNENPASTLNAKPTNNYTTNGDVEMNSRYVKIKMPVDRITIKQTASLSNLATKYKSGDQ